MDDSNPGLELVFDSAKGQFKSKNDAMICLLHWNFIANGYKCIGAGEETGAESSAESEYLPQGWNQSSDVYTIRYQSMTVAPIPFSGKKECYLLKVVSTDDTLIVNLMSLEEKKLASKIIKTSDYVTDDWNKTWNNTYKNIKEVKTIFKEEFLNTVSPPRPLPNPSSGRWQERDPRYPYIDDPLRIPSHLTGRPPIWSPYEIGRADLDPFSEGGGMIFDPFLPNRRLPIPEHLPRGAIPPGARYDPIGPGRYQGRPDPDPDHLPLPNSNDYDDMFM